MFLLQFAKFLVIMAAHDKVELVVAAHDKVEVVVAAHDAVEVGVAAQGATKAAVGHNYHLCTTFHFNFLLNTAVSQNNSI